MLRCFSPAASQRVTKNLPLTGCSEPKCWRFCFPVGHLFSAAFRWLSRCYGAVRVIDEGLGVGTRWRRKRRWDCGQGGGFVIPPHRLRPWRQREGGLVGCRFSIRSTIKALNFRWLTGTRFFGLVKFVSEYNVVSLYYASGLGLPASKHLIQQANKRKEKYWTMRSKYPALIIPADAAIVMMM